MLTAAVRDLHAANPGQFETDVRTSADALWENNPHLTRLSEGAPGIETLDMHYPLGGTFLRYLCVLLFQNLFEQKASRVGTAPARGWATLLFKPDEQISRIRLSRRRSTGGIHRS